MPIYEYECQVCEHRFEKLQKVSDVAIKTCEKCAGPVEKIVSKVGFRLQGGGWYETDFKSNKDHKKNLAEVAISSNTDKSSSPPSTTKTETITKQE